MSARVCGRCRRPLPAPQRGRSARAVPVLRRAGRGTRGRRTRSSIPAARAMRALQRSGRRHSRRRCPTTRGARRRSTRSRCRPRRFRSFNGASAKPRPRRRHRRSCSRRRQRRWSRSCRPRRRQRSAAAGATAASSRCGDRNAGVARARSLHAPVAPGPGRAGARRFAGFARCRRRAGRGCRRCRAARRRMPPPVAPAPAAGPYLVPVATPIARADRDRARRCAGFESNVARLARGDHARVLARVAGVEARARAARSDAASDVGSAARRAGARDPRRRRLEHRLVSRRQPGAAGADRSARTAGGVRAARGCGLQSRSPHSTRRSICRSAAGSRRFCIACPRAGSAWQRRPRWWCWRSARAGSCSSADRIVPRELPRPLRRRRKVRPRRLSRRASPLHRRLRYGCPRWSCRQSRIRPPPRPRRLCPSPQRSPQRSRRPRSR